MSETYGYDGDGARVSKLRSSTTTLYLEGLWEETVSGTTKVSYRFNGALVAVRDTNAATLTYLHSDHLGSVSLTTTSSGASGQSQEYDAWGAVRSGSISATSHNYTGQVRDSTGLVYFNARFYDPAIGRFISPDTIVPGAGILTIAPSDAMAAGMWFQRSGGPNNPQDLNRYSYVGNNPIKNTDPTGHCLGPVAVICMWYAEAVTTLGAGGTIATQASRNTAGLQGGMHLPSAQELQLARQAITPEWMQILEGVVAAQAGRYQGLSPEEVLATAIVDFAKVYDATISLPAFQMKGEYIPPGLRGQDLNTYREAVHRYKKAYGLGAAAHIPKHILDQIAEAIKNGANAVDAADDADSPPEDDLEPPKRR